MVCRTDFNFRSRSTCLILVRADNLITLGPAKLFQQPNIIDLAGEFGVFSIYAVDRVFGVCDVSR